MTQPLLTFYWERTKFELDLSDKLVWYNRKKFLEERRLGFVVG
jgi:hypothetical protein